MLKISNLVYRIEGRLLFDNANAHIQMNKRIALVGQNGTGKTTLLRLIRQEISPESGTITVHKKAVVGSVAQEAPSGQQSLIETVLNSNERLFTLNQRAKTETDPHEIAYIHQELADMNAHEAPAQAARILAGLGFSEEEQNRPCSSFSGGWRMRVALASVLFNKPDLLLLDEPTNYLDLEGVIWLENFLKNYPYTVIIVSHDRDLLNRCVEGILLLKDGTLNYYSGNYDQFEDKRRIDLEQQSAMRTKQEAERRHLQKFVDRFRYKASKAKQAQSRLKMIARLKPIVGVSEDRTLPCIFPNPEPLSPPLIRMENVSTGYEEGKAILSGLDIYLDMDDRIGLLGKNGNGKSTFAKLISGKLPAFSGEFSKPRSLKIGYFAQHQLDELKPAQTPFEHFSAIMPHEPPQKIRATLGSFGFGHEKIERPVETLSGGEKARLLLALVCREKPHILILDEPTNHLDVDSREALIHALNDYEGAIILITHDRHMIETCVDRLLIVDEGTVKPYDDDLDAYKRFLLSDRKGKTQANESPSEAQTAPVNKKEQRKLAAEARQKIAPIKHEIAAAEKKMSLIQAKIDTITAELADPKYYDSATPQAITDLQKEKAKFQDELSRIEAEWLDATEKLENYSAS